MFWYLKAWVALNHLGSPVCPSKMGMNARTVLLQARLSLETVPKTPPPHAPLLMLLPCVLFSLKPPLEGGWCTRKVESKTQMSKRLCPSVFGDLLNYSLE